jgi:tripartite-type tricarboxylate transporter receptor subunit TctC
MNKQRQGGEQMKTSRIALAGFMVVTIAAFAFVCMPTAAQSAEPTSIRLVVPSAAGSGADSYARLLSDRLGKILGKPVVVENFPGAGGIKGVQEIIRAPRDGYTIGLTNSNIVIYPSIFKDLPYDPTKDITHISIIGTDAFVLVTYPGLAVQTTKELIAMAKSQPGKLNYGSPGSGSVPHLVAALFLSQAEVNITHVPYKGGSQLTMDVMGGHVQLAFMAIAQGVQQIKAGKLRALGVSSPKRHPALPEVPTLAEAGLPNYSYEGWVALVGPPNLPQPIVKKVNAALLEVLKLKEVRDGFATQGTQIVGSTPEEAARIFKADLEKNARAVKQSGAKQD